MKASVCFLLLVSALVLVASRSAKFDRHKYQPKQLPPAVVDFEAITAPTLPELTLHVISHTHDDIGWLKTVDEYYVGSDQKIQDAGVQYILDGVIQALQQDPQRKFIYVEIGFFIRWWNQQTEEMKQVVRDLVSRGQLEFINGGWCMNDEAGTHYTAVVDQMTSGHQFLFDTFGVKPRIGWHIDPFGHASSQASMFAQMGYDAFFFGRIDYADHDYRNHTKNMEFIWRNSDNFGKETDIWSHLLYTDYCYFHGFNWENGDAPIQDDPRIYDVNVKERADLLAHMARQRAESVRHNNVLMPFGCDFQFEKANINYKNMDKLMKYVNSHPEYKIKMVYSTPSMYLDYVHRASLTWSVKTGDFFPYADGPHAYWTGYFTSRPGLKGYVREVNNFAHAADKFVATSSLSSSNLQKVLDEVDYLDDGFGIAQHHDAVAGTEKQHVANDYAKRLSIGVDHAGKVFHSLLESKVSNVTFNLRDTEWSFCPLLNESICPSTQSLNQPIAVSFYNPLGWNVNTWARIPVPTNKVQVLGPDGKTVASQVLINSDFSGQYTLVFSASVPPVGHSVYFIQQSASAKESATPSKVSRGSRDISMENENYSVTFSPNGRLSSVTNKKSNVAVKIAQEFYWYNSSTGNNALSVQPSGAYIFRPNGTYPVVSSNVNLQTTFTSGPLVSEFKQVWNGWLTQIVRLYSGSNQVEFEATVKPMDISDGLGKELIGRYYTNLKNNGVWYSDSQGLELLKREYLKRPDYPFHYNITEPESMNYVPMNEVAYIQDSSNRLTFLTDRSRGCAVQGNGQFETMLQRRILHDDYRGVGENLNETETVRLSQWMSFQNNTISSRVSRREALMFNNKPTLSFATVRTSVKEWVSKKNLKSSAVNSLPPNVHLLNLKTLREGRVVLRLHHIFSFDEDSTLSQPASVDFNTLFTGLSVVSVSETQLTANEAKSSVSRKVWKKASDAEPKFKPVPLVGSKVTLRPMEIRTFIVRLQKN